MLAEASSESVRPLGAGRPHPAETARARDGRWVRIVPNPAVPVPVVLAVPLLAGELGVWAKPPASACFPLHPLGVLSLYERAKKLLLETGVTAELSPEQLTHAEVCMSRFAAKLYKPGHSIRACVEATVEDRGFQLREGDDRDPFVAQPGRLAAWLVLRAALELAEETA
jgi:hypothetical protein